VAGGGFTDDDRSVIQPGEIATSGMDYVALGHWHAPSEHSAGGVTAWYSGAPEVVEAGQREPGGALLVTLSAAGTRVERLATGALRCEALSLDVEAHPDEAAVESALVALADPNLLLSATLTGLAPEGFTCDLATLQEELAASFFRLQVADATSPAVDPDAHDRVAGHLVAVRAAEHLRRRMDEARAAGDETGERVARRALQLAIALFDGREVLG
jgi:DNA repair exonuclease SbcCD nuclease subunit